LGLAEPLPSLLAEATPLAALLDWEADSRLASLSPSATDSLLDPKISPDKSPIVGLRRAGV
jgi:hypothetical protein